MVDFYEIHRRAIDRGFNYAQRPGEYFRVIASDPLSPVDEPPPEFATVITFRRLSQGRYEPADIADRRAIAEWNERYRHASADAWDLPKFMTK